jgi:hypothetical protein
MEKLRGHLLSDESIFTFTRGFADFRAPTAVFRLTKANILTLALAIFAFPSKKQRSLRCWQINRQFGWKKKIRVRTLAGFLEQGFNIRLYNPLKGCHAIGLHHNRLKKVHKFFVQK